MNTETEITYEIVPASAGLPEPQRESLQLSFASYFQRAEALKAKAATISDPKEARAARLEFKKVRTEAEATRKKLKEDSLRMGKAIDGANNILLALIVPLEEQMEGIEKAAERAEAARIAALVADRTEQLQSVGAMVPANLAVLTDDQFDAILRDAMELQRIKREREEREEAERQAKAEAERLERIRIEEENARLKEAAIEAARLAKIEADRIAAERAEEQRKAKAEAERLAAIAAKERAEAEAEKQRLKAEADKIRAEKEALEAKARAEAAEAERKAKAEAAAAAKAAKAPSVEKLKAFAASVRALEVPAINDLCDTALIISQRDKFANWLESLAK